MRLLIVRVCPNMCFTDKIRAHWTPLKALQPHGERLPHFQHEGSTWGTTKACYGAVHPTKGLLGLGMSLEDRSMP